MLSVDFITGRVAGWRFWAHSGIERDKATDAGRCLPLIYAAAISAINAYTGTAGLSLPIFSPRDFFHWPHSAPLFSCTPHRQERYCARERIH